MPSRADTYTRRLRVRLTDHDKGRLEDIASQLGWSISDTIRAAVYFSATFMGPSRSSCVVIDEFGTSFECSLPLIEPQKGQVQLTASTEVVRDAVLDDCLQKLCASGFSNDESQAARRALDFYSTLVTHALAGWTICVRGVSGGIERYNIRNFPPTIEEVVTTPELPQRDLGSQDRICLFLDSLNSLVPGKHLGEEVKHLAVLRRQTVLSLLSDLADLAGDHLNPDFFTRCRSVSDLNDILEFSLVPFQRIVLRVEHVNDVYSVTRGLSMQFDMGATLFTMHSSQSVAEQMAAGLRLDFSKRGYRTDLHSRIFSVCTGDATGDKMPQYVLFDYHRPNLAQGLIWNGCDLAVPYTVMSRDRIRNTSSEISHLVERRLAEKASQAVIAASEVAVASNKE